MGDFNAVILVIVIAVVTMLLRFLPFAIFSGRRKASKYIMYLGDILPSAIIGMLIVYCLRSVDFTAAAEWLPSVISVFAVLGLHIWKHNTILSIVGGTLLHMFLVRII